MRILLLIALVLSSVYAARDAVKSAEQTKEKLETQQELLYNQLT